MKVIIAGGSGFLGRALRALLDREGAEIVVLSRRPPPSPALSIEGGGQGGGGRPETRFFSWDGNSPGPWAREMEGADAVVNLSGASVASGRWSAARKRELSESRLLSTRALVQGMAGLSRRPRAFISASAVGYYGDRGAQEISESSPAGRGFLAELCVQWEAEARKAEGLGVRAAMPRTGIVLHPEGGALPRMLAPFKFFFGGPLGGGEQWMSWIHLKDWARLIRHLIGAPVSGPVNAVSPNPVTNAEFSRILGRALGRPSWLKTPAFLLRGALGEMAGELLLASQRAYPRRAVESGFTFLYPELAGALRDLL